VGGVLLIPPQPIRLPPTPSSRSIKYVDGYSRVFGKSEKPIKMVAGGQGRIVDRQWGTELVFSRRDFVTVIVEWVISSKLIWNCCVVPGTAPYGGPRSMRNGDFYGHRLSIKPLLVSGQSLNFEFPRVYHPDYNI
jgi:hypothetical protein